MKHSTWKKFKQVLEGISEAISKIEVVFDNVVNFPNILKSELMIMSETLEQAGERNAQKIIAAVTTAAQNEANEIKTLIKDGQTAAAIAALDALGDRASAAATAAIAGISDAAQAGDTNPPSGETGTGG